MIARRSHLPARRAFTLIEVVMSLLVLAILLAAVEASLVASTKAIPDPKNLTGAITEGAGVVNRFTGELACALSVTEMGTNAIAFTVPDRNGDGTPETIRYAWSGTAGAPLTRQYNAGAVSNVAASVGAFNLGYEKTTQPYYTSSEGAETLVYSFANTLLAQDVDVASDSYPAHYIVPSWPASTLSWRVTRIKIRARTKGGANGRTKVQIRTATPAGSPTNRVLDEYLLDESSLDSNYAWIEIPFANHSGLSATAGVCFVMNWVNDTDSAQIQKNTLSLLSSSKYLRSTNGGSTWSVSGLDNMLIYVYGKPMQPNPVSYNYFLKNVRVALRTTTDTRANLATSVNLLNSPQVVGP
jgi:prepilin-type N-terminal cleavage/methylation domain-containing protein